MVKKSDFIKEYRAMLEKLLETKVRLAECKNLDKTETLKLQAKLDGLIDKLIGYMHKSVDKSMKILDYKFEGYNEDDQDNQ